MYNIVYSVCSVCLRRLVTLIDGKGAGKGCKFMGKANRLSQKHKVEQLIKEYLVSAS